MAPSGFGPYHGMWLEDAQTKNIGVIPTPWAMTHVVWCHFIHSISSWFRNREQKNVTGWECAPRDVWRMEMGG
jgi:hypothetical protein